MIEIKAWFNFTFKNEWWDHVIVAPDDNKIREFNRGIPIGLKAEILQGGHIEPNSIFGVILLWKNAQKNLKKNIISDKINIIILNFKSFIVVNEWCPCNEDSRFTSRHHRNVFVIINNINEIVIIILILFLLIEDNIDTATDNNVNDEMIGQGLGDTKWNGFLIFIISEFH